MITHIKVDGYKTLSSFELRLNPGLNILVGPNGSGKTNIVSFFEFLAHLVETDAAEAVSKSGGAGAVFRKVKDTYQANISATVRGCFSLRADPRFPVEGGRKGKRRLPYAIYQYEFVLLFSNELESVVFTKQRFSYKPVSKFVVAERWEREAADWSVELETELDEKLNTKARIKHFDAEADHLLFYPFGGSRKSSERLKEAEAFLSHIVTANTSVPSVITRYNPGMMALSDDITGGQAYNIIPSRVKRPEDSAKPPGIASDGSGLSPTLFALKKRNIEQEYKPWFMFPPTRKSVLKSPTLDTLKSYFQLANAAIKDIDVVNDTFNNQLRVSFIVESGEYTATVPLSFMSDGTLKWLTLVTAALTAPSVFSIEEPENYLHPQMQAQFISIMREILFREKKDACTLMTTHSETVLNHCRPDELIVISFGEGKTVAHRSTNQRELSIEIEKTGFGLGYYYIAGAIEDE